MKMTMFNYHIATDPTYKLLWQGFSVFMFGATNRQKLYQPFGLVHYMKAEAEDFNFCFNALKTTSTYFQ